MGDNDEDERPRRYRREQFDAECMHCKNPYHRSEGNGFLCPACDSRD